ncbi:hypothetical protein [Ovoidimarina sediminis]|uniref:hypothetical protein n=1 Tax=Ovoidimarina sediminis TaxID=3079856 RepID=UPI00291264EF|nr:hypothetical protein [Rhodophyticola sp. MJ-SS7]MDU8946078.1 hypothetical protein [Rhodophyticola sp. MJ-SS7]
MTRNLTKSVSAIAIAALTVVPLGGAMLIAGGEAVSAAPSEMGAARGKSGTRGRGGEEHAGRDGGAGNANAASGRGAVASELRGLNAAHAIANGKPRANAESQVGRIVTYQREAQETIVAFDAWQVAYDAYKDFEGSYDGPSSDDLAQQISDAEEFNEGIDEQIDALDPESDTYDDDVAALEDQKIDVGALEDQLDIAEAYEEELKRLAEESNRLGEIYEGELAEEKDALDAASGGRDLSDAALAALRQKLGL